MKTILFLTVVFIVLFIEQAPDMHWLDWGSGLMAGTLISYWVVYFMFRRYHDGE